MAESTQVEQVLVDNGDGTVTDNKSGLMWQKDDAGPMDWKQAVATCEQLNLAGKSDWRLPDLNELKGLYKAVTDDEKLIDRRVEPFTWTGDRYWSSKVVPPYNAAFLLHFVGGSMPWEFKVSTFHVRAVRGPDKDQA